MPLFTNAGGCKLIRERPFEQEKDMQKTVEQNLPTLFGLEFVASEFAPQGDLRIDTLAFDADQNSFVIIEFKKGNSWSVIDQGYAYLALMLNNKADFVLKYNESLQRSSGLKDIDWEASRVMFVAPSFNTFQQAALGFQDLPFDLWEIRRFEGDLLSLNQLQASRRSAKLSDVSMKSTDAQRVQQEVKTYSVDDHFHDGWERGRELFDRLSAEILQLDPRLSLKPMKRYIAFEMQNANIVSIRVQKSSLILDLVRMLPQDFDDPQNRVEYHPQNYKHISQMKIVSDEDIPYAVGLARQTLRKFGK